MKKVLYLIILLIVVSSCAHSVDINECALNKESGFWQGIWHGLVIYFSFIGSWFSDVTIYAVHNNGFWYNFGYIIGLGSAIGGTVTVTT